MLELPTTDVGVTIGPSYPQLLAALSTWFRRRGVPGEESKDLGQETIVRTLIHLKRHGQRGEDLKPLVFKIARNLLIERARRPVSTVVALTDEIDVADDAPTPLERVVESERRAAVADGLAALGSRHRRVIELWMSGDTPADIARTLGIKRNAADALLHRARRRLAAILRESGEAFGSFAGLLGLRLRRAFLRMGLAVSRTDPTSLLSQAASVVAVVGIAGVIVGSGSSGAHIRSTGPISGSVAHVMKSASIDPAVAKPSTPAAKVASPVSVSANIQQEKAAATTEVVNPTTGKPGPIGIELWHEKGGRTGKSEAVLNSGVQTLCSSGCPTVGGPR